MRIQTKRISAYTKLAMLALICSASVSFAANHLAPDRISDISNTKHNFAANATVVLPGSKQRQVRATSQNETCVFCHTPHGLPSANEQFLWNRDFSTVNSYSFYSSSSMDAPIVASVNAIGKPTKMCLSCHDGTVAVGAIKVVNGRAAVADVAMTGDGLTAASSIKDNLSGHGNYSLGTDLTNDHPISFEYSSTLAQSDGELVDPSSTDYIGARVGSSVAAHNQAVTSGTATSLQPTTAKTRIAVPLEGALASGNLDNLNSNTFASLASSGTVECTSCHDPHIRSTNADENIKFLRLHRFQKATPSGGAFNIASDQNCLACHKKAAWHQSVHANSTDAAAVYDTTAADVRDFPVGTKVWEAGCLSCHDTHTESGAKLLLREGANLSGSSAREETCYQCHGNTSVLQTAAKNIQSVISLTGGHSGISSANETHTSRKKADVIDDVIANGGTNTLLTINSGNHVEKQSDLVNSRHVECSDCHHPHRMQRNAVYDGSAWSDPTLLSASLANNFARGFASGSLRGVWGIEPSYTAGAAWGTGASSYNTSQGDVSDTASFSGTTYITKEYQVCFKCHTSFANGTGKTDKAMEFQPSTAAGRSWHPVVGATNRDETTVVAGYSVASLNAPYNATGSLGKQTMNCSDCHASDATDGTKGPHGSTNASLLIKGNDDNFCLTCHSSAIYDSSAAANPVAQTSGFSCANGTDCQKAGGGAGTMYNNLHNAHATNVCDNCHVKIPHGWKNKALLVNKSVIVGNDADYYSVNAVLSVPGAIPASGAWTRATCSVGGCHAP